MNSALRNTLAGLAVVAACVPAAQAQMQVNSKNQGYLVNGPDFDVVTAVGGTVCVRTSDWTPARAAAAAACQQCTPDLCPKPPPPPPPAPAPTDPKIRTSLDRLDIDEATKKLLRSGGIVDVEGILEANPQKLAKIVGSVDLATKLIAMAKALLAGAVPGKVITPTPSVTPVVTPVVKPARAPRGKPKSGR